MVTVERMERVNSSILRGRYGPIAGVALHAGVLVRSVLSAVCRGVNINLTTPRINVLGRVMIVSIKRNPVILVGPRVVRASNRRANRRNYLDIPKG